MTTSRWFGEPWVNQAGSLAEFSLTKKLKHRKRTKVEIEKHKPNNIGKNEDA
jgi:hypothetical protein